VLQGAAGRMWPSVGLPLFGSAYYNAPHEPCEAMARSGWATSGTRSAYGKGRGSAGRRRWPGRWGRPLDALPVPRGPVRQAMAAVDMRKPAASPTRKGGETTG
jgi:hypothetical protein